MTRFIHLLAVCAFVTTLFGCAKGEMFPDPVQNNQGALKVMNADGFIGATIPDTAIDYDLQIMAVGGLDIANLHAELITNDPITFKGGEFPGEGGTCTDQLSSGKTCSIKILYSPENTNSHRADIHFTYEDVIGAKELNFTLTADSHPILRFAYGNEYDFGNKFLGSSTDLPVKITNIGKVNAGAINVNNLNAPYSFKGGSYPGTGGTCGNRLLIGETCELIVNYSPTDNVEHRQDITFDYLNTGRPESSTLHLLAFGFTQAQLTFADSNPFDFGRKVSKANLDVEFVIRHTAGDVAATNLTGIVTGSSFSFRGGVYPGTGGTCGTQISKSGSCSVFVTMRSETSGSWSGNLQLRYSNGASTVSVNKSLIGSTALRPKLSITPSANVNYGMIARGQSHDQTFTVNYLEGEIDATLSGFATLTAPFSVPVGAAGGTCVATLASGSCTVVVRFTPLSSTTQASLTQATTYRYNDGYESQQISVTHAGTQNANVAFSAGGGYGSVLTGLAKTVLIQINNTAGTVATAASSSLLGASDFAFAGGSYPGGGSCSNVIPANGSCTVGVTFTPSSEGPKSASLNLSFNDGIQASTLSLALSGTGSPAASLEVRSYTAFGSTSVNQPIERTIPIRNTSSLTATSMSGALTPPFSFKGGSYPGTGGSCSVSLSGSGTCNVIVVYNPISAGTHSQNLVISYNNGSGLTTLSEPLAASAVATDSLFLSGNPVFSNSPSNFYNGQSISRTFTLSHGAGSSSATGISFPSLSGETTITSNGCSGTLSNGESCSFTVTMLPTAAGAKSVLLQISYDNGAARSVETTLTATVSQAGKLIFSAANYGFGDVSTADYADQLVTVTKVGSPTSIVFSPMTANFIYAGTERTAGVFPGTDGNCTASFSVTPCTIALRFTPTAVSSNINFSYYIRYYNGFVNEQTTANLSGNGIAAGVLRMNSNYSFGDIIQTTSKNLQITLLNTGSISVTSISSATLTSPFSFTGGAFPGTTGTCGTSLAAGSDCKLDVTFSPVVTGERRQNLILGYNNGSNPKTVSAELVGNSISQAIVNYANSGSYNFGSSAVGSSKEATIEIANAGGVSGTALSVTIDPSVFQFKGNLYPGTGGTCGSTIAKGLSCTVVLAFVPTSTQSYSAGMVLSYHDGIRTRTELKTLQGTGN